MNDKITFQELVDAIAEQTGKSKQFTHDFIKDFASLIKEGLEKDGTTNIAGLGKFELKKMDEGEGYNLETEENISIPAHNKIDFTPYKDLRELVNTPYSHMKPEIIEEEGGAEEEREEAEEDQTDEGTAASDGDSDKKKAPWEEDMDSEIEIDENDPFGLNAKRKSGEPFPLEKEDTGIDEDKEPGEEDVIEFSPDITSGGRREKEIDEEFPAEKTAAADDQKSQQQETAAAEAKTKSINTKPRFRDRSHRRQDTGGTFWIIAAAFIILLLAIGAWYMMVPQQEAPPQTTSSQTTEVPDMGEAESQGQTQATQPEDQEETSQQQAEEEIGSEEEASAEANQTDNTGQQAAAQTRQTADPNTAPPVETITVTAGQTLWGLADNEYQNPYLWPWIYDTNKPNIDDPDIIYTGQLLDIPQRRGQNNQLSNSDSLQVALGYVETYLWYKENNLENARFYLYAAKKYHSRVFEYTDATFDEDDLRFANRAQ